MSLFKFILSLSELMDFDFLSQSVDFGLTLLWERRDNKKKKKERELVIQSPTDRRRCFKSTLSLSLSECVSVFVCVCVKFDCLLHLTFALESISCSINQTGWSKWARPYLHLTLSSPIHLNFKSFALSLTWLRECCKTVPSVSFSQLWTGAGFKRIWVEWEQHANFCLTSLNSIHP